MQASETSPHFERAKTLFLGALAALGAGRLDEAEQGFRASLQLLPDRISTLVNLAATQLRLAHAQDALATADSILRIEPGNAEGWFHKASALLLSGRHAEALKAYEKTIALGPPAAEPWFRHGQMLQALDRPAEALDSYDSALALDTTYAQAWSNRGSILREMDRNAEAAEAFRKALAHGADPELHTYYLASVSAQPTPSTAPSHYVETLFDDYAEEFDTHLVDALGYQAHTTLVTHLATLEGRSGESRRRFGRALDLGCGTGLCGPLLKPMTDWLEGVDLSGRMLGKAQALGVYDRLTQADIVDYLSARATDSEGFDLLTSADVFIYVGDLVPVFAAAKAALAPGGIFCFSAERAADDAADFVLLPSLRYAHSERYLRALAAEHGFDVVQRIDAPIREDQRDTIPGLFVYLERAAG